MKTPAPKKTKVNLSTLSLQVEQADRKAVEAKERVRLAKGRLKGSRKALKLARKDAKHARRLAKDARKAWVRASGQALAVAKSKAARRKTGEKHLAPAKINQAPSKGSGRMPKARKKSDASAKGRPAAIIAASAAPAGIQVVPGTSAVPSARSEV